MPYESGTLFSVHAAAVWQIRCCQDRTSAIAHHAASQNQCGPARRNRLAGPVETPDPAFSRQAGLRMPPSTMVWQHHGPSPRQGFLIFVPKRPSGILPSWRFHVATVAILPPTPQPALRALNDERTRASSEKLAIDGGVRAAKTHNRNGRERLHQRWQVPPSNGTAVLCMPIHPMNNHCKVPGAGRAMSRQQSLETWRACALIDALAKRDTLIRCPSSPGVPAEAPGACKGVTAVVDAAEAAAAAHSQGLAMRHGRLASP